MEVRIASPLIKDRNERNKSRVKVETNEKESRFWGGWIPSVRLWVGANQEPKIPDQATGVTEKAHLKMCNLGCRHGTPY